MKLKMDYINTISTEKIFPHLVEITEDFTVEMLHFNQMKVIQSVVN